MSVEEFLQKVAWPGVQPSPLGGGEASAAQEPQLAQKDASANISEPSPPKPFIFESELVIVQEDVAVPGTSPHPEPEPSAPVLDLPISQDPPSAAALDLDDRIEIFIFLHFEQFILFYLQYILCLCFSF